MGVVGPIFGSSLNHNAPPMRVVPRFHPFCPKIEIMKSALSAVLVVELLLLVPGGHVVRLPGVVHGDPFLYRELLAGRVVIRTPS